ncbi:hypothetical protein M569_01957 [Genlisea aurea]|uniref:RING-type E3 ubiquitin transferase n=1 Tax=Genlisea aurea TaxID=192259 RepID=S8CZ61_9LAMI|nr:hypothetical protein M569_01957 [Genlisea aurea]
MCLEEILMAKKGAALLEESPSAAAKKDLKKMLKAVLDDDDGDFDSEAIDRAMAILSDLKGIKSKKGVGITIHDHHHHHHLRRKSQASVPEEFKCPLSKELMKDPVIIASGQTFDRPFINKWLKSGNRTCPQTLQVLSHTVLTPNHLIREMISRWCADHGIELPDGAKYADEEDALTESDRDHFLSLLAKMSSTLPEQKQAAKELRRLTKNVPSFRALFGESPDAIPKLLFPLSRDGTTADLQEDVITSLLNISIHDNNKKLVAETPAVIPLLVDALKSGTMVTRSNSAAALFTLSALDSNKTLIGRSGALKALVDLLNEGDALAAKDAASAIFNLCIVHENKTRAVAEGAVPAILKKISGRVHVEELVSILTMLSNDQRAVEEMGILGATPFLLEILRATPCPRNKENCVAILYAICCNDRSKWKEMREEESRHGTISQLAQNGTSRAKRKASGILDRLSRRIDLVHTA